jgi:hypothetical protein
VSINTCPRHSFRVLRTIVGQERADEVITSIRSAPTQTLQQRMACPGFNFWDFPRFTIHCFPVHVTRQRRQSLRTAHKSVSHVILVSLYYPSMVAMRFRRSVGSTSDHRVQCQVLGCLLVSRAPTLTHPHTPSFVCRAPWTEVTRNMTMDIDQVPSSDSAYKSTALRRE